MAEWQADSFVSHHPQPALDGVGGGGGVGGAAAAVAASTAAHRALQHTSGNAQSYADGAMNGDGSSSGRDGNFQPLALKQQHPLSHPLSYNNHHHHHPVSSASAHDNHILAARMHAKKLRRLQSASHPASGMRTKRSYLKSQKYLEYRARPRRDTGKDGEPVWSDALEDAFQQGQKDLYTYLLSSVY